MGEYTKTYNIVDILNLEEIEIHEDATITFDDGSTENYKAIHFDGNDYIIGEIREIKYEQEYARWWGLSKRRRDESMNVFLQTGHIKEESVKAINCKEMKSIYHLDKKKADSKLYRIVNE